MGAAVGCAFPVFLRAVRRGVGKAEAPAVNGRTHALEHRHSRRGGVGSFGAAPGAVTARRGRDVAGAVATKGRGREKERREGTRHLLLPIVAADTTVVVAAAAAVMRWPAEDEGAVRGEGR